MKSRNDDTQKDYLSINFLTVQRLLIRLGVPAVLLQGAGEVVVTRHVFFGAEKQIIVTDEIQYGVNGSNGRDTDRSRRKTLIQICVVGRLYFRMFGQHPPDGKIAQSIF